MWTGKKPKLTCGSKLFNFPRNSQSPKVKKWYYLSEFMFQLNVSISAGLWSAPSSERLRVCSRSISALLVHVEQELRRRRRHRQRLGILECVLIMFARPRNLKPILIKSFGYGFVFGFDPPRTFFGVRPQKNCFFIISYFFYWKEWEKTSVVTFEQKTRNVSVRDRRVIHIGCCQNKGIINFNGQLTSFLTG